MNRQQKEASIAEIKQMFSTAQAAFLVKYQGLNVNLSQTLRRDLRENGGLFKITKATLMRIAAKDLVGADDFAKNFKDQIGIVFAQGDVTTIAKKLKKFSENNESLKLIAGFFEARVLSKQDIEYLASLPSREILLAQVVGTMQAPIASFVRLLNLLIVRLLYVLKKIEEEKQKQQ
jgi:large subunit ribosomal protein L10